MPQCQSCQEVDRQGEGMGSGETQEWRQQRQGLHLYYLYV